MDKRASQQTSDTQKEKTVPDHRSKTRETLGGSDRIEALRERLYRRGADAEFVERHAMSTNGKEEHAHTTPRGRGDAWSSTQKSDTVPTQQAHNPFMKHKKRKRYRIVVALAGVAFFVVALLLSSSFLFFGNNTISGNNISISVNGPFTVGGGDQMPLQVAVSNENAVAVESALLVIEYPSGTQSASEVGKELFTERIPLNRIDSGEVVNVPIRALVYGEENEEKVVHVSVEYRVSGSNATFFKEADPYRFKISSSPVTLTVDTVRSVTSGQEIELELSIQSNAPSPVSDLLVQATYPFGFDFLSAEPEPVSEKDTWRIPELKPEEKRTITVRGVLTGKQNEERVFDVSVGVANERDRFALASHFVSNQFGIAIEEPFIGLSSNINGSDDEVVVIGHDGFITGTVSFKNTLENTLYDGEVTASLAGNALDETEVVPSGGFYDSADNTITWSYVDLESLEEIPPGKELQLTFRLTPKEDVSRSPEITMDFAVKAKRVYEDRVPQELSGILTRTVRLETDIKFDSSVIYSDGPFTNTGPVPPIAEEVTQYTVLMSVDNGSNGITGGVVTATLPTYVTWLDLVTPGDIVRYNATTREITWNIGDMEANTREEVWMQISFKPSLSQVGSTPVLIRDQQFRATDRFTGTALRENEFALSTALLDDPDQSLANGSVRRE